MIDRLIYSIGTFANGHWQWLGPALLIVMCGALVLLIYYTFKEDIY